MNEIDLRAGLSQHELFELFRLQLQKDFEVTGCDAEFTNELPSNFEELKGVISVQLKKLGKSSSSKLPELLYRIDINENHIKQFTKNQPAEEWEALIAELIIKRILQKIILKKTYSKK